MISIKSILNPINLIKISIGLLLVSFALNYFLLPHDIASAGVGSVGHLLYIQFGISGVTTVWIINVIMLLLTYILLDKKMFSKILIGSLAFPVFLDFVPSGQLLYSHLASLLIGSALFSLGIFALYKANSSNGGVTIPPIILEKYFKLSEPIGLFFTNVIIIVLNFLILGPMEGLFAALSIVLMSFTMKFYYALDKKISLRLTNAVVSK